MTQCGLGHPITAPHNTPFPIRLLQKYERYNEWVITQDGVAMNAYKKKMHSTIFENMVDSLTLVCLATCGENRATNE